MASVAPSASPPAQSPPPASPSSTTDPTEGWKTLILGAAATINYPPSFRTLDCGENRYYPGQETWWVGPNSIGGCQSADANPAPIAIVVGAQLQASYTDTSGCGGTVSQTSVTADGVAGVRYDEGPCTSPIVYLDRGPDLYYIFYARGEEVFLDYNRSGVDDLSSAFDTMVMDGLRFAG